MKKIINKLMENTNKHIENNKSWGIILLYIILFTTVYLMGGLYLFSFFLKILLKTKKYLMFLDEPEFVVFAICMCLVFISILSFTLLLEKILLSYNLKKENFNFVFSISHIFMIFFMGIFGLYFLVKAFVNKSDNLLIKELLPVFFSFILTNNYSFFKNEYLRNNIIRTYLIVIISFFSMILISNFINNIIII